MIRRTLTILAAAGTLLQAQQPQPPCDPPRQEGPRRDGSRALPGHGPEGMPGHGPGRVLKALGLTQDQEAAVRAILDKHRAAEGARRKAAGAKEAALRAALEDPATPDAQLKALHAQASDARFEAMLAHRAVVKEIEAVLTPEQQAKARRIRENLARERAAHAAVMEDMGEPPMPPAGE